eukprot:CAMPEP_0113600442 /NCGR_PEP_ID=MMETSP0015_2-20120614/42706_1 /TAXON_ID=2838 /ORGANISM="Odontella" /LENGTH=543 /DNA_ID=CAMNT_0000508693 /DNA_START=16 /DNA_END=1651 /DNA_ORIENTATION=- /assembly_acc=CAM_ASM_000160
MTVHGLAASIRSATESETFDLGGQTPTAISTAVSDAFREPLENLDDEEDMIRITFVVGAGKQNRQKYDDGAAKAVTSALLKLGYAEDRASSCVAECGGTFKLQHDTGKNLKTVVVFPRVSSSSRRGGGGDGSDGGEEEEESLIPENSPGWKIAVCSMVVFRTMIDRQCPSWSQKKGCAGCIEALNEMVGNIDAKLMKGAALEGPEQSFYDAVSDLDEKEAHVRTGMHEQVEKGDITKYERDILLEYNAERIRSLEKEGKSTVKALQRKELLESIDPVKPPPLRLDAEIRKFHRELTPLLRLEERARGRLLTVEETRAMARKDEIMEEIEYLEDRSRGWFEEDDVFESRVRASRAIFEAKRAKKSANSKALSAGSDAARGKSVAASKWVLPGQGSGGRKRTAQRPKGKLKGSDVFSAMMMDSDSSSDEESESEASAEEWRTRATQGAASERKIVGSDAHSKPKSQPPASPPEQKPQRASKKSKKKKKKKKKPKQTGVEAGEGDAANVPCASEETTVEGGASASRAAPENEEEATNAVSSGLWIL